MLQIGKTLEQELKNESKKIDDYDEKILSQITPKFHEFSKLSFKVSHCCKKLSKEFKKIHKSASKLLIPNVADWRNWTAKDFVRSFFKLYQSIFFAILNRWLKNIEHGKLGKKYQLKEADFKGAVLKNAKDFPFVIVSIIEKFGIRNSEDQKIVLKHIECLVDKNPSNFDGSHKWTTF